MSEPLTPESSDFIFTWGVTFAIAGGICALLGVFVGWIIWRNTRNVTEFVEDGNRDAFSEFETMSDEVSRIRAELSGPTD